MSSFKIFKAGELNVDVLLIDLYIYIFLMVVGSLIKSLHYSVGKALGTALFPGTQLYSWIHQATHPNEHGEDDADM